VNTSSIDRLLDTAGLKFPGLSSYLTVERPMV
jgi:hypothetical protein